VATLKEYTNKIALSDNFTKCAERKEGDQYQETYYTGRNQLVDSPPTKFGKRVCNGPMMHSTCDNLLKGV
jgi:hypothetical protein